MAYNINEAMYNLRGIDNLENITEDQLDDIFNGVENSYMSIEGNERNGSFSKDTIKRIKEIFSRMEKIYEYLMNENNFICDSFVTKELEVIRDIGKVFTI